jgi:D-methionine transport system ATP-binding protein
VLDRFAGQDHEEDHWCCFARCNIAATLSCHELRARHPLIQFQQVGKVYSAGQREIVALQPLDLTIGAGEVFGIVGHSGAGKSTLLRLINRLETPSGGRLTVDGTEVTALDADGLRAMRRRIGMIFQHFNLLSSKTVAANIAFPLELAGMPRRAVAARVDELLAWVGLAAQRERYPAQLSGGQKQRVGIARALATAPKILLCDEATSALDPQTTASVLELLDRVNRELGLTIVLITHEMDVIRRVCDRVAVLDAGRLVETGRVADVFLHPQHPTTRRFVNESERLDETGVHRDYAAIAGRILRLTFLGDETYQPVLGRIARETGIDYTILAGRIDRIKDTPYGQLTVSVIGGDVDAAQAGFAAAGIHVEELRR